MNQREKLIKLKTELAQNKHFKSRCYICLSKKPRSGFTFHHIWYEPYDLTYKDFKTSLAYYENLKPFIIQNPERFMLLCSDHHQALERMLRWRKNLPRLIRAVKITQKARSARSAPERFI